MSKDSPTARFNDLSENPILQAQEPELAPHAQEVAFIRPDPKRSNSAVSSIGVRG